jgi:hypothetical protein
MTSPLLRTERERGNQAITTRTQGKSKESRAHGAAKQIPAALATARIRLSYQKEHAGIEQGAVGTCVADDDVLEEVGVRHGGSRRRRRRLDRRSGEFPRILASDWFKRGRGIAWKEEQRNVTEAKQTRQLFDAGGRARRPTDQNWRGNASLEAPRAFAAKESGWIWLQPCRCFFC